MRRVSYFLITNLAILIVLGTVLSLLGIEPYLIRYGIDYPSLLIFAAIFGMGSAFISLALSKWTAKRLTDADVIDTPHTERDFWVRLQERNMKNVPKCSTFVIFSQGPG